MKNMSTPLASIYSTSVMEHHHFNQTVTILQQVLIFSTCFYRSFTGRPQHSQVHDIWRVQKALSTIKHCILATDLALFFPNRFVALSQLLHGESFSARLADLVAKNEFDLVNNRDHRWGSQFRGYGWISFEKELKRKYPFSISSGSSCKPFWWLVVISSQVRNRGRFRLKLSKSYSRSSTSRWVLTAYDSCITISSLLGRRWEIQWQRAYCYDGSNKSWRSSTNAGTLFHS